MFYLLSLAVRARKLAAGAQAVISGVQKNRLHLILIAEDASPNLRRKIERLQPACPMITYGSKDRLGQLLQRTELGVIGILDSHFADGLKRELQRLQNPGTKNGNE